MEYGRYNFNYGWSFRLAGEFPLQKAAEAVQDEKGRDFWDPDYQEKGWEEVSVPHTYNDKDLFVARIQDAGSGQKRTFACYRKWFGPVENVEEKKVFLEFEGIRQTCYLYVNGRMAGYLESGIAPFGFDITPYVFSERRNLIAIATDNTSSRELDFFGAETPNLEGACPGSFIASLTRAEEIPPARRGVEYSWNCNDFNPSVGGLTRNIRIHCKPRTYLTLPLYSNLRTKGCYVYAVDYNIEKGQAVVHGEAQVRNESGQERKVRLELCLYDQAGEEKGRFSSEETLLAAAGDVKELPPWSVIPKDAYLRQGEGFVQNPERENRPTETFSPEAVVLSAAGKAEGLHFWSPQDPYLYRVLLTLYEDGEKADIQEVTTGFRLASYDGEKGLSLNGEKVWLTGYAQRAANEWAAIGCAPDWLKDQDALWIRQSNANHIRFMHVAGCPADVRAYDRYGIVCTQPAGDKERETFGRQWCQRMEAMRDVIIYFRNSPSILFWEAGNNSINAEHMRQMRELKELLDPNGGRFMGCRTINTMDVVKNAEYVGTMLNRHAARFQSERMPVTETEYLREEAPRRVWDDFTPPDYDYDNLWLGKGGRKQNGGDCHDLTSEDLGLYAARGYAEFFHDRVGGASGRNLYSAAAALCWTDSAQHGRQAFSENARMSGRVDPVRIAKQSYEVFKVLQAEEPTVYIMGHWNYPPKKEENYRYAVKAFDGCFWRKTGEYAYRNPEEKTVYVIGSYPVARVELYVNGKLEGSCDKPQDGFVFAFPNVDVTRQGYVEAIGYDYAGNRRTSHRIETAGCPSKVVLALHTGEGGLRADRSDIAYVDVSVVDEAGRVCSLCDSRIDFTLEGEGIFLGGYNSGRFDGYGREDSVIHKNHVFAECGVNRVFIRSTDRAGKIRITAKMEGITGAELEFESVNCKMAEAVSYGPKRLGMESVQGIPKQSFSFPAIKEADQVKYTSLDKVYCKVLLGGQEPATDGILSIVEQGSIFSPVLFILEAMKKQRPQQLDYTYDAGCLTLCSGCHRIQARVGHTHLLVDGEDNLMGGEPYLNGDGVFIMEINAIIPWIEGATAQYDDMVQVFRIEWTS